MKNERSLYWTILLYEDSENLNFKDKIKIISKQYEYLYILHDKDIKEDTGELKKKHYHIVLKFKNYKWKQSLAEELDIPMNYLEKINNLNNILCYLIHYKEENKHHYNLTEVKGTALFKNKLNQLINNIDKTECDKVIELSNYIFLEKRTIKLSKFVDFVCRKGYWDTFRRSSTIFIKLIEEHNFDVLSLDSPGTSNNI